MIPRSRVGNPATAHGTEGGTMKIVILTILILLAVEFGPPIYRASVPEGLAVIER